MSYLSYPRLYFAGQFQADTSSVNNDPAHFDDATFQDNYQEWGDGAKNGWWNPHGTAYWRFRNCKVTGASYGYMEDIYEPDIDPLIGMPLNESNDKVSGKLVDLDPEQQMVSQIWGFQISVGHVIDGFGFQGNFDVTPFAEIWGRYPEGHPDSNFSAYYQSILSSVEWSGGMADSPILGRLYELSKDKSKLSIKFTVDSMDQDRTSPTFSLGRVIGVIGVYEPGEPRHFVAARCLNSATPKAILNSAPCQIDHENSLLLLDLGNSLPTAALNGPPKDLGDLQVMLKPADSTEEAELIGVVDYRREGWLEHTAGIQAFPLTSGQLQKAQSTPIAITNSEGKPYLIENAEGAFVRSDNFVYRIEAHHDSEPITLYATKFGHPAAGELITLSHNNAPAQGQRIQGVGVGPLPATPINVLKARIPEEYAVKNSEPDLQLLAPTMRTDEHGKAIFTLHADDPGNPRVYIDGQVYGVGYDWVKATNMNSNNFVSVLVFDAYACPDEPTWDDDVGAILQQYANLYPVMKNVLDLGDYESVIKHAEALKLVFGLPVHDPNYMPVTRDLSAPKREMLLKWLENPIRRHGDRLELPTPDHAQPTPPNYEKIDPDDITIRTPDELRAALQNAIELEHATIPPYLTGLYSIMPGKNQEATEIIRSVVMEEMLHMSLACNLLNAIGGSPDINNPHFVPDYNKGQLPGGVAPGLRVYLKKCSKAQIHEVFMKIEEPSEILYPIKEEDKDTIGAFYHQIRHAFILLEDELQSHGETLFTGDPDKQLTHWHTTGQMIAVHDLDTALSAIDEIVEQGEGTSPMNPDDGYDELAHYYKFAEIYYGRRLVIKKGQEPPFDYSGSPIPFDEEGGVYPMQDKPDVSKLPAGSQVRMWAEEFNRSYANLLNALHETFNGNTEQLRAAIGLMFSLEIQAKKLMQIPVAPGSTETAGPSFQLPTANSDQ